MAPIGWLLPFSLSLTMLGAGAAALAVRLVSRSISIGTVLFFHRLTNVLFIAFLLVTSQFYLAVMLILLGGGAEFRAPFNSDRNYLFVVSFWSFLCGTFGLLGQIAVRYLPAAFITMMFLMLIGMVWAAFVESKPESQVRPGQ